MGDGTKVNGISVTVPVSKIDTTVPPSDRTLTNDRVSPSSNNGVNSYSRALRALTDLDGEFTRAKDVMSVQEYLDLVDERPQLLLRPISKYITDAIDYVDREFGAKTVRVLGQEAKEFAFLRLPWKMKELKSKEPFRGHPVFWNKLYSKLKDFSRMAHPNNILMINGPKSTGKSCAFDSLFELLEYYSKTEEGALYSFEWIFDNKLSTFGFHNGNGTTHSPIAQKDIVLSISANNNSIPFFLFNPKFRKEKIEEFIQAGHLPEDFNKDFVLSSQLDKMSETIKKGFYSFYKGVAPNAKKEEIANNVLRNVQVFRWQFSKDGGKGLVLKQPTTAPDTVLIPIMPETNWDLIPPQIVNVLSKAGLFAMKGTLSTANNGVLYLDDMFRGSDRHKGVNDFLYTLRLGEKGDASVPDPSGIVHMNENFHILHIGTVNDSRIAEVAQQDGENLDAIKDRADWFTIEHERCYRYVAELFEDKLNVMIPTESERHISPNVLDAFSLWVTMTHLFPTANDSYYDGLLISDAKEKEKLKTLAKSMTLLEKALLYQGEDLNAHVIDSAEFRYNSEAQQILQAHTPAITNEYNLGFGEQNLAIYEGCVGLPSRVAERILASATRLKPDESFTVLELFHALEQACKRTFKYELDRNELITAILSEKQKKLKNTTGSSSKGEQITIPKFPSTEDLLSQVKAYMKRKIKSDVCKATEVWKTKSEVKSDLQKYFAHVRAYITGDKIPVKYRVTSSEEKPNITFLRSKESAFGISEKDSHLFRTEKMGNLAAWMLDHSDVDAWEHLDKIEKFRDLFNKLEAEYTKENWNGINNFISDLKEYISNGKQEDKIISIQNDKTGRRKETLLKGIEGLQKMGYSLESLVKEVIFAFQDRPVDFTL